MPMRAREEAASAASSRVPRAAALWAAARWPKPFRHCRRGFALRFARRSVRGIFRHVHTATKNDLSSFRRGRKPGRGFGPFLDFSGDVGTEDGGPRSGACFCWECLLSAWPRSGFGGEGLRICNAAHEPGRGGAPSPPAPLSPADGGAGTAPP